MLMNQAYQHPDKQRFVSAGDLYEYFLMMKYWIENYDL